MTREELKANLEKAKVKGFDIQAWMIKEHQKDCTEDSAIDYLLEDESRLYDFVHDYKFMLAQDHRDIGLPHQTSSKLTGVGSV